MIDRKPRLLPRLIRRIVADCERRCVNGCHVSDLDAVELRLRVGDIYRVGATQRDLLRCEIL